jgi:hypothetical protein
LLTLLTAKADGASQNTAKDERWEPFATPVSPVGLESAEGAATKETEKKGKTLPVIDELYPPAQAQGTFFGASVGATRPQAELW